MRSFLLAILGFVSPENTPNEVTNQELLDKVNALTLELNEVKKYQTQSNVHFLAMISENIKSRVKRYIQFYYLLDNFIGDKYLKFLQRKVLIRFFKSIRSGYTENCRF